MMLLSSSKTGATQKTSPAHFLRRTSNSVTLNKESPHAQPLQSPQSQSIAQTSKHSLTRTAGPQRVSRVACAWQVPAGRLGPSRHQDMHPEIYKLFSGNKPLPKGTRIKTTRGGIYTGGDHELSETALESANRVVNGYFPFWIHAWRDLHSDLLPAKSTSDLSK